MSALLSAQHLRKLFPTRQGAPVAALADVSFSVSPGEVLGIVGESGSGKSTIANLVLGLVRPDTGTLEFRARPIADWLRHSGRDYRRRVQAVFQQPTLSFDPRRTLRWSMSEPLVIHDIGNRAERRRQVDELLELVGLRPELADRLPGELSGGQLQRASIARALALEPWFLVCDEPVSALDVSVQAQILNVLLDVQVHTGVSMMFISHDLAVVRHLADRILVLRRGRVIEVGDADAVFDIPADPYTASLVAAADARGG